MLTLAPLPPLPAAPALPPTPPLPPITGACIITKRKGTRIASQEIDIVLSKLLDFKRGHRSRRKSLDVVACREPTGTCMPHAFPRRLKISAEHDRSRLALVGTRSHG